MDLLSVIDNELDRLHEQVTNEQGALHATDAAINSREALYNILLVFAQCRNVTSIWTPEVPGAN